MTTAVETPDRTEQNRRPLWMAGLILATLIVLSILAIGLRNTNAGQVEQGPAPEFTLETFDGETISLSDFEGEKPVVINFWASWCLECYDEAPMLEQAWRNHGDEIMFLGIDYNDTEPAAKKYMNRFDITYPNGFDYGNRISDAYRVRGVPETYFVRRDGTMAGVKIGPLTQAELDQWIERLQ